jgi:hypothetical protein
MRKYLIVAALASGGFAIAGPVAAENPQDLLDQTTDLFPSIDPDEIDVEGDGILAVEVDENATYILPREDHGDAVTVAELRANSSATHLDLAGVERSAAGRPVDAPPGSRDAANTGMQHDLGAGTVTNTVSQEPTPSLQVQAIRAADLEVGTDPAPQEAQATST